MPLDVLSSLVHVMICFCFVHTLRILDPHCLSNFSSLHFNASVTPVFFLECLFMIQNPVDQVRQTKAVS